MKARQTIAKDGVEVYRGFRIRLRCLKTCTRYVVDLGVDGKRERHQFDTIDQARGHCEQLAVDQQRLGTSAYLLSEEDRTDAVQAKRLLEGTGASLLDAARELLARRKLVSSCSRSFGQLSTEFLDWMADTSQKLSARSPGPYREVTIRETRKQLLRAAMDLGDINAAGIDRETVRRWLDGQGFSPSNWDHHRRAISMLYSWATREGGLLAGSPNPAARMASPASARSLPAIYSPQVVAQIMAAVASDSPTLVPYFAVGFFGGIRPEECLRVLWSDIDFEAGEILVRADASKTYGDRLVTMPTNLVAWLRAYPLDPDSPLGPSASTATRTRAKLRARLGLTWPVDVARHCYATYHCALHGMDATAEQLGHSSTAMLHRHYRGLARNRKRAAQEYFAIVPVPKSVTDVSHESITRCPAGSG